MATTVHNVTITIEADSPKKPTLCNARGAWARFRKSCEWQTDTDSTVAATTWGAKGPTRRSLPDERRRACPEHIHVFDVNCEACRAERLRTDVMDLMNALPKRYPLEGRARVYTVTFERGDEDATAADEAGRT